MKMSTQIKAASRLERSLRISTGVLAFASMIPFTLAASASEQKSSHGAAPAHKAAAKPAHSKAGSRVFGSKGSKHAAAKAHGPKHTPAKAHGPKHAPAKAHGPKLTAVKHGTTHGASGSAKTKGGHGGHWGYSGDAGPSHWGSLKSEYALCGAGKMQSPIDISGGLAVTASNIDFNYRVSDLTIRNNGHTVQVDYKKGSHIVVNGHRYDLLQFHFHSPSEHLIDGKTYPLEMHLVHKNAAGALAVVGVMMEPGESNIALEEVWNHLPKKAGKPARIGGVAVNARDLLPEKGSYHHYKGSLTTPPCSEGVNWFVLAKPVQVSAAQISKFTDIVGNNARPTQSAHNRLVISEK